jgi:hypothetical protein
LTTVLLIDAANVVGSRPTGWWRDRPGAARDLIDRLRATILAGRLPGPVVVVLEGDARAGVDEGLEDDVIVVHAPAGGDDTLVEVAEDAARVREQVLLVSADRELGRRVEATGGRVTTPGWLLSVLAPATPPDQTTERDQLTEPDQPTEPDQATEPDQTTSPRDSGDPGSSDASS